MHRFLDIPLAGTRLPALVIDGWGAGESEVRPHAVPAPTSRWTLLVLSSADRPEVDEHRPRLAAEAVTVVVAAGSPPAKALVLVDPAGVVQHVADTVEDALDVVAAFRNGMLDPIPADAARPLRRCPDEGRRRSAVRALGRRPV